MPIVKTGEPAPRKPLRLWPGVVIVVLQWLLRFGLKLVVHGFRGFELGMLGGLACVLAFVVWWAFFSRAALSERWGAIVLMIAALFATLRLNHESMGPLWLLGYAIPVLCLAFVAWAVASRGLSDGARRATMVATILLACGVWTAVRTEGLTGDHDAEFAWRWTKTPEQRLLAHANDRLPVLSPPQAAAKTSGEPALAQPGGAPAALPPPPPAAKTVAEWPGFRGPGRNGIIPGVRIETDWSASPPVELWRRPVGPGWSSFAVGGHFLYTQEQRGDEEVVACYSVKTGKPVWRHGDAARFFESNGGAGPRATPTLGDGRVYTFGATGILNALDADSGAVVWSRKVASDIGAAVPIWGFSSSPLVVDDLLIVAAEGRLVAYDLASGDKRWLGRTGGTGYSSPQMFRIDGVPQILLLSGTGATSVAPATGRLLWEYRWPGGFPIVQPGLTEDGDILISAGSGTGTRRIAVTHSSGGWTAEERWTSKGLKPYFNDFVVHDGYAFGFDDSILSCIDLKDGKRKWKGGRYGNGQLVLLSDQDLLLVLSEEGELALVGATPGEFRELARFPAITGKTWNHPALAGNILLVRNAQEMAAFRLSPARH
ncbi:MAG: PQQ-binding-like beta-propeller repeat protein [Bryobacteraceae bacterium]|jgi:outer membrane protein assembly factor BamB